MLFEELFSLGGPVEALEFEVSVIKETEHCFLVYAIAGARWCFLYVPIERRTHSTLDNSLEGGWSGNAIVTLGKRKENNQPEENHTARLENQMPRPDEFSQLGSQRLGCLCDQPSFLCSLRIKDWAYQRCHGFSELYRSLVKDLISRPLER